MGGVLALLKLKMGTTSINNPSPPDSTECATDVHLPQDLITEILLYLPVKSLVRFKCVSKPWLTLISSPEFVKSHYLTSLKDARHFNHQLLLIGMAPNSTMKHCSFSAAVHNPSTIVSDIECPSQNGTLHIVGIVNGLVCLSVGVEDLYIYNPISKQSKHLPSSTSSLLGSGSEIVVHSFGYDESNDDYKVVKLWRSLDDYSAHRSVIKVYSLRSDSWRRIEGFDGGNDFGKGSYANGKIFWTNLRLYSLKIIGDEEWKIVSLDMASYKYEVVKVPCYETLDCRFEIASFGGSLYLLCYWLRRAAAELWVMDVNGVENSWSKVCFLDYIDSVLDPPLLFHTLKKVVCILEEGEILLEDTMGLIVYRTKTKDFRKIQLDGKNYREFFVYVESLVAL